MMLRLKLEEEERKLFKAYIEYIKSETFKFGINEQRNNYRNFIR